MERWAVWQSREGGREGVVGHTKVRELPTVIPPK